jgi:hypothetical protein
MAQKAALRQAPAAHVAAIIDVITASGLTESASFKPLPAVHLLRQLQQANDMKVILASEALQAASRTRMAPFRGMDLMPGRTMLTVGDTRHESETLHASMKIIQHGYEMCRFAMAAYGDIALTFTNLKAQVQPALSSISCSIQTPTFTKPTFPELSLASLPSFPPLSFSSLPQLPTISSPLSSPLLPDARAALQAAEVATVASIAGVSPKDVLWVSPDVGVAVPHHCLIRREERKEIVLCIRGTTSLADVITDARALEQTFSFGTAAHEGIASAAVNVYELMREKIISELSQHPGYKLVITGHSMGAGAAILLTTHLYEERMRKALGGGDYDFKGVQVDCVACKWQYTPFPLTCTYESRASI